MLYNMFLVKQHDISSIQTKIGGKNKFIYKKRTLIIWR